MMEALAESPWLVIAAGALIEALLAVIFVQTGRGVVLVAVGVVLVLVILGVVGERLIVTERESIEMLFDQAVDALEANDVEAVLALVAPDAGEMHENARRNMARITIREAHFNALKIHINRVTNPHTAHVEFIGRLAFKDEAGTSPYENFVRRFTIELRKDGDRWLMTGYEMHDDLGL